MAVPMRQTARMGGLPDARSACAGARSTRCMVELEPLFQCNLACAGCGKIQHPEHVLRQRMPVDQAIAAIEECGAPMVSIAGGEPLVHPEIDEIAAELVKRKKFVYLCTNALLMEQASSTSSSRRRTSPGPCTSTACASATTSRSAREGVFDKAVEAIREAKAPRLPRRPRTRRSSPRLPETACAQVLDFLNDELEVDQMMISPGLRVREGARSGALPRRRADARAVPRGVRRRPAQASGA